jgi:ATP-dependent exoDNAse (exonuclease V) alpha subunit
VVVDEASMADTRTLTWLLHRTQQARGTLVLVGDPAQLPEVGAGGLFHALARHPQTHVLAGNQRQTEPWEQRALADLRAGDATAAIAAYADHDRIHPAPADQLPELIVGDYLHTSRLLPPTRPLATRGSYHQAGVLNGTRARVTAVDPSYIR